MRLTVVVVHYRTPELLEKAVMTVRDRVLAEAPGSEIVVVDNGSEPGDQPGIDALPARVLRPGENLGYAGGINVGVRSTPSEGYLVLNPDVVLLPGCLLELTRVLSSGIDVAGPSCAWDDELRFLMPPSDPRTRRAELLAALASRYKFLRGYARSSWRQHARAHWQADKPLSSEALTGAILAFTDHAWKRTGAFDQGYQLYFEETDWLRRAKRAGLELRYVPGARSIHRFARSTKEEPRAQQWFADSAARFRRSHYGSVFSVFLERLAREAAFDPELSTVSGELTLHPQCRWVEVSPNPIGFPAVGERLEPRSGKWSFPDELTSGWKEKKLWVTQCDDHGRELSRILYEVRA